MNGTYYPNPTFPGNTNNYEVNMNGNNEMVPNIPMEQSYIENILRANKGKMVKAYVSFPDASDWKNKIFEGRIEQAGRDHLIISNPNTGEWDLILMIYLDFVTFDEPITYAFK